MFDAYQLTCLLLGDKQARRDVYIMVYLWYYSIPANLLATEFFHVTYINIRLVAC